MMPDSADDHASGGQSPEGQVKRPPGASPFAHPAAAHPTRPRARPRPLRRPGRRSQPGTRGRGRPRLASSACRAVSSPATTPRDRRSGMARSGTARHGTDGLDQLGQPEPLLSGCGRDQGGDGGRRLTLGRPVITSQQKSGLVEGAAGVVVEWPNAEHRRTGPIHHCVGPAR